MCVGGMAINVYLSLDGVFIIRPTIAMLIPINLGWWSLFRLCRCRASAKCSRV